MKLPPLKQRVKHIHFIGIGGVGMSGIAEVLLHEGYYISGSDPANNAAVANLRRLGADIYHTHQSSHLKKAEVVVVSSAISKDNPEWQAAMVAGLPIIPRAEMLAELMRFRYGIAVAGSHGKTTTTSLVASILAEAELEPTFVIGGLLNSAGSNANLGKGQYLVAEADESDGSFLCLNPIISIITNIDRDHLSHYDNNFETLQATFVSFIQRLPFYGLAVLCLDDPIIEKLMPQMQRPHLTYGEHREADYRMMDYQQIDMQSHFMISIKGAAPQAIELNMPGRHNALNALAAIVVAQECGVPLALAARALQKFQGVGRRLQSHGRYQLSDKRQVDVYDDYGHHPREIEVTIESLRSAFPNRRLCMVFQPHRYSRTADLFEYFSTVLSRVDTLLLLPVYDAGEAVISGAESKDLHRTINSRVAQCCHLVTEVTLLDTLAQQLKAEDVLVMQGAGSVSKLVQETLNDGHVFTQAKRVNR